MLRSIELIPSGALILLSIRNLSKTFTSAGEPVHVLRGVDLDLKAGERVALTGESGSGKSPLLHLIATRQFSGAYGPIIILGAAAGLFVFGFAFEPALSARGHAGMAFRLRLVATVTQAVLLFLLLPRFGGIGGAWATFGGSLAAVLLTGSAAFRAAPAVSARLAADGPPR